MAKTIDPRIDIQYQLDQVIATLRQQYEQQDAEKTMRSLGALADWVESIKGNLENPN